MSFSAPTGHKNIALPPGDAFRILREQRGFTQGQVAAYAGISKSLLSDFERGASSIHLSKLIAIAELLGTPILWGGFKLSVDIVSDLNHPDQDMPE